MVGLRDEQNHLQALDDLLAAERERRERVGGGGDEDEAELRSDERDVREEHRALVETGEAQRKPGLVLAE